MEKVCTIYLCDCKINKLQQSFCAKCPYKISTSFERNYFSATNYCCYAKNYTFFCSDCSRFKYCLDYKVQGCSEGTSSVSFEVLILNCQIYIKNLFILNCLTWNIKLFIFKLFDVKYLFSKNHVCCKQKKMTVYGLMDARP